MAAMARNAAPVREPTAEELTEFHSLADILVWAKIKGNPLVGYTQAGALMEAIAGDEFEAMTAAEFASISAADFEAALADWKFSQYEDNIESGLPDCDLVPNALIKGRARAAHRAARIWQSLEFSTNDANAYNEWALKAMRQPLPAPPAATTPPAAVFSGEMVRLHETVDYTRVREVQMMTETARLDGLELFLKLMLREPFPEEKPSLAQMTSLLEILKCKCCYVDFALWGSFHIRTARNFRFRGLAMGPGGTLIEIELKGPPSFEFWSPSWKVFQCGMISADAAIPPVLIAYRELIKGFNRTYGEKCWPLLYQQDVRFRQEYLPELLHKETKKLEASMLDNTWKKGIGLDANKPWNHCFSLLHSPEVEAWWSKNFEKQAMFISVGVRSVTSYLSGDASVCSSASSHMPSVALDVAPDANSGKRARTEPLSKAVKADLVKLTPCEGYNIGRCEGQAGKVCPKNSQSCHKCNQCGSMKHSVLDCPQRSRKPTNDKPQNGPPWKKDSKGGKGGKKGGKGGKGGKSGF